MTAEQLSYLWSVEELDGMFIDFLEPKEFEAHLESGAMILSYEGVGGLLGLAKLRIVHELTAL